MWPNHIVALAQAISKEPNVDRDFAIADAMEEIGCSLVAEHFRDPEMWDHRSAFKDGGLERALDFCSYCNAIVNGGLLFVGSGREQWSRTAKEFNNKASYYEVGYQSPLLWPGAGQDIGR